MSDVEDIYFICSWTPIFEETPQFQVSSLDDTVFEDDFLEYRDHAVREKASDMVKFALDMIYLKLLISQKKIIISMWSFSTSKTMLS